MEVIKQKIIKRLVELDSFDNDINAIKSNVLYDVLLNDFNMTINEINKEIKK